LATARRRAEAAKAFKRCMRLAPSEPAAAEPRGNWQRWKVRG
jgi:hypothetical protein